jgi:hypothetical protein
MSESAFEWLRAGAFLIVLLPALIENLRSERITNAHNVLIFLGGAALLIAERLLVATPAALPWVFWMIALLAVLIPTIVRAVPGGIAKFMIALLPWFASWESYTITVTAAFFAIAAWGHSRGGQAPVVPGFYAIGLMALVYTAA